MVDLSVVDFVQKWLPKSVSPYSDLTDKISGIFVPVVTILAIARGFLGFGPVNWGASSSRSNTPCSLCLMALLSMCPWFGGFNSPYGELVTESAEWGAS